ncbi:MAG: hypothetical protein ROM54_04965 [Anaerobiospirillum sp.]|nr:hypothetical protein [Anaerobiospirillum sp.]
MGKTYVFPDDTKALLIFEVNGEEMFISPMQQQDIRLAYQIYQSPQIAADMINLLQFRTGSEVITPEMVEAVMARPPLPHPTKPETNEVQESAAAASDGHEAIEASVDTEDKELVVAAEQVTAVTDAESEKPEEPEEPAPPVIEDEETFDLWGKALHIPLTIQQDIICAYRILGSAEAAVYSLNRTKQQDYGQPVTVDMVQAVITRLLRQEGNANAE